MKFKFSLGNILAFLAIVSVSIVSTAAQYYTKLTVTCESPYKVAIKTNSSTPGSSDWGTSKTVNNNPTALKCADYYVYAKGSTDTPCWYEDGVPVFSGSGRKYSIYPGSSATTSDLSRSKTLTMRYRTPFTYEGLIYLTEGDGTARVASGQDVSGDIIIPAKVSDGTNTYTVTSIEGHAFSDCIGLTSVDFSNTSITSVGMYAFPSSIVRVYVPKTLTTIYDYAFYNCANLELITDLFDSSHTLENPTSEQIADYSYLTAESNISELSQLSNVTKLGDYSFNGAKLTSVALPNTGLKEIPALCFKNCRPEYDYGMSAVILSESIETLGESSFNSGVLVDQRINYPGSGETIDSEGKLTFDAVVIPPNVKTIGYACLQSQTQYESSTMYLPASVTTIGTHALYTRNNLQLYSYATSEPSVSDPLVPSSEQIGTLHIPVGTSKYYTSYFKEAKIVADIEASRTVSFAANQWTSICFPERAKKPEGIEVYTLSHKLLSEETGETVGIALAPLGEGAALAAGVPYIVKTTAGGDVTFEYVYGAKPATTAKNSNGLCGTFEDVENVYTITSKGVSKGTCSANGAYIDFSLVPVGSATEGFTVIDATVREDYIFSSPITAEALVYTSFKDYREDGGRKVVTVTYPTVSGGSGEQRLAIADLDNLAGDIVIPEKVLKDDEYYTVTTVDFGCFKGQTDILSVIFPKTIEEILTGDIRTLGISGLNEGSAIFAGCENLEEVRFDTECAVTDLGAAVFANCSNLTSVILPSGLESIAAAAFYCCPKLESLTFGGDAVKGVFDLPRGVASIGSKAFGFANAADAEASALKTIVTGNKTPADVSSDAFSGYTTKRMLVVPFRGVSLYNAIAAFNNNFNIGEVIMPVSVDNAEAEDLFEGYTRVASRVNDDSAEMLLKMTENYAASNPNRFPRLLTDLDPEHPANFIAETEAEWRANSIILTDGVEYALDKDVACDDITYTRVFTEAQQTTWQPLYVPFDIESCEGFATKVIELTGIEEKTAEELELQFRAIEPTEKLLAHHCYIVKPAAAAEGEYTGHVLAGAEGIKRAVSAEYGPFQSANYEFKMYGTYSQLQGLTSMGAYVMSGGDFMGTKDNNTLLKPFRLYLVGTNRYSGSNALNMLRSVTIKVDDETIGVYSVRECTDTDRIYTLDGREVTDKPVSGIYIINGKKVMIAE